MEVEDLKKDIISLWQKEVREEFQSTGFMWERHLQAVFYYHLKNTFPEMGIWVEPVFKVKGSEMKPDLLLTSQKEVVAIIELKFNPWQYIVYQDDLNKLIRLQDYDEPIALACQPISYAARPLIEHRVMFQISSKCLMVFASVGRDGSAAFDVNKWGEVNLPKNFLNLHGYADESGKTMFLQS